MKPHPYILKSKKVVFINSSSQFSRIRQQLDNITKYVERERLEKDERISEKFERIKEIESDILERVHGEMEANRNMQKRLTYLVEQQSNEVHAQLSMESKQRIQVIEKIKKYASDTVGQANAQYAENCRVREEADAQLFKRIEEESARFMEVLEEQKKVIIHFDHF